MMNELLKVKITKPSKMIDVSKDDKDYFARFPEKLLEHLETERIDYLELIKHFPYYNKDKTIWVDAQFGKLLKYDYLDPSKIDEYRDEVQYWPDLEYMASIPGKGFNRDIAICNTQELADEIEDKILGLKEIETVTKNRKHYPKTIKQKFKKVKSS